MSIDTTKLYALKIENVEANKRRSLIVLADNSQEAEMAAALNPLERMIAIREITGLERFFERLFQRKVNEREITKTFPKIARLLSVQTPLEKAFKMQLSGLQSRTSRYLLLKIMDAFSKGESISEAFEKEFSSSLAAMLKSAEKSNEIEVILMKIGMASEKKERFLKKLITELIYPGIVLSFSLIVMGVFLFCFLPQIHDIYQNFGAKLPGMTAVLYQISIGLKKYPFLLIAPVLGIVWLTKNFSWVKQTKIFQAFLYRLPRLGKFIWKKDLTHVLEYFSLLLTSGVALENALHMSSEVTKSLRVREVFVSAKEAVIKGNSLAYAFLKQSQFLGEESAEVINALEIGEQAGDLEKTLNLLVEGFQAELEFQVNNFNKLLGPLITLFLAGVGAIVVVSILYPLAKLTTIFIQSSGGGGL